MMSEKLKTLVQDAINQSLESRDPELQIFAEMIVVECFKAAMIESNGRMNPIDLMAAMKLRVGLN